MPPTKGAFLQWPTDNGANAFGDDTSYDSTPYYDALNNGVSYYGAALAPHTMARAPLTLATLQETMTPMMAPPNMVPLMSASEGCASNDGTANNCESPPSMGQATM